MNLKRLRQILAPKEDLLNPPKVGEIVKGKIIEKGNSFILLDIGNFKMGIIYGKEYLEGKENLKDLKVGDEVFAKVIGMEEEQDYVELSPQQAKEDLILRELKEKKEKGEELTVKIIGVNRGGLLTKISGIPAFLPLSQLSPENFPKLENPEPSQIVKELQRFINKELKVKIINLNSTNKTVILSEKALYQ